MNLWLRLAWLILTAGRRERLAVPFGVSRLNFWVWPGDLDTSLHMNNGRYWTLMDLGRTDLMLRSSLWRVVVREGWIPVVTYGAIRFRRELRPFQRLHLQTRLVTWTDTRLLIEHVVLTGSDEVATTAFVQGGLYDRRRGGFIPVDDLLAEVGATARAPLVPPELQDLLSAVWPTPQARGSTGDL